MREVSKNFGELSARELYEILRARAEVFVVEQKCPYLDPDGIDERARHVFIEDDTGRLLAYLRFFPKPGEPSAVQIGRVLARKRGRGLGMRILRKGIEEVRALTQAAEIYIEAQTYTLGFYRRAGFEAFGEAFDEDGISHTRMRLKLAGTPQQGGCG